MTDRAHIRNGQLIRKYEGEKGKVLLEKMGEVAMPVVIGYVNGNDKVVPYKVVTKDTSTGADTVRTTAVVVGAKAVTETVTIRDKTAQEIEDEAAAEKDAELSFVDRDRSSDKALAQAIFRVINAVRALEGKQPLTAAQFKTYLRSLM